MNAPGAAEPRRRAVRWGREPLYPIQSIGLLIALFAGAGGVFIFGPVDGAVLAALPILLGLTWRSDHFPVIPFCLGYQWTYVASGTLFLGVTGHFPGREPVGDLATATHYSLAGLLFIALGVRVASRFLRTPGGGGGQRVVDYSPRRLFYWVVAGFSFSWVFAFVPANFWFGAAQPIANVLYLRFVPLILLFHVAFTTRRGFRYTLMATGLVMVPEFATGMSGFKEVLFVITIVALSHWRPWARSRAQRQATRRVTVGVVGMVAVLVTMGLLWNGLLKARWREELWSPRGARGNPMQKALRFAELVAESAGDFELDASIEDFAVRLSSAVLYFSHAIDRVPAVVAHEDGALLRRSLKHVVMPRFLFPSKLNLGGDSWIVRRYAGVWVAGDKEHTSVGMGYIPEFYVDFGFPGVIGLSFLYGGLLGLVGWILWKVAPNNEFFLALLTAVLVRNFLVYEATFAKALGGVVQTTVILSVIVRFGGLRLHRSFRPRVRIRGRSAGD